MADIRQGGDDHVMGAGPSSGRYTTTGFEMGTEEIPLERQTWLGNMPATGPSKTISCRNCGNPIEVSLKAALQFGSMLCRDCNPDFQNSRCAN